MAEFLCFCLSPNWIILIGETVTVRCEIQGGEGAQWTYEWRQNKLNTPPTSNEYRIITVTESDGGEYSCRVWGVWPIATGHSIPIQPLQELGSHYDGNGPILVSPVHPVTEGASVSLTCSLRTQKILSNVFFYHNDKLIQNDPRGELKISAVSKSDEGFYKCQYSGRDRSHYYSPALVVSLQNDQQ
uniref:Ig-like domain-containing protein n=1 Tax=Astatotilapia calliptera TaxID=8154 RepID=A0A3P8PSY4_ASTCA